MKMTSKKKPKYVVRSEKNDGGWLTWDVDVGIYLDDSEDDADPVFAVTAQEGETTGCCGINTWYDICAQDFRKFKHPIKAELIAALKDRLERDRSNVIAHLNQEMPDEAVVLKALGFKKTATFLGQSTKNTVTQWNYTHPLYRVKKKSSSAKPRVPSHPAKRATR